MLHQRQVGQQRTARTASSMALGGEAGDSSRLGVGVAAPLPEPLRRPLLKLAEARRPALLRSSVIWPHSACHESRSLACRCRDENWSQIMCGERLPMLLLLMCSYRCTCSHVKYPQPPHSSSLSASPHCITLTP